MRVFGAIFILVGFFFCLSIIGAVIGVPLILIGLIMVIFGGHRRTIVTNVVQVSNQGPTPHFDSGAQPGRQSRSSPDTLRANFEPRLEPPLQHRLIDRAPVPEFEPDYDEEPDFTDLRSEITKVSKQILALAQQDGYEIRVRPDCVILAKQGLEDVLKSNGAIWQFARTQRYSIAP